VLLSPNDCLERAVLQRDRLGTAFTNFPTVVAQSGVPPRSPASRVTLSAVIDASRPARPRSSRCHRTVSARHTQHTAKLYAVKHNPFPYVAEIQDSPAEFAKQFPLSNGSATSAPRPCRRSPTSFRSCRDMHGIGNVLAPCGGVNDTDDNDVRRGDDESFWL